MAIISNPYSTIVRIINATDSVITITENLFSPYALRMKGKATNEKIIFEACIVARDKRLMILFLFASLVKPYSAGVNNCFIV